ncbi:MAG: tyrosine-type recombinase/integrase [Lachnospiraceae bacterium]|nr:tyrosine-type recombinase/integrase [Lachnospiraceae bacterium]
MKIKLRELECYQKSSEEMKNHKLVNPERGFELTYYPTKEIQKEMEEFIFYRGQNITVLSIRAEIYPFNQMGKFLCNVFPELKSFKGSKLKSLEQKYKAWLLDHHKNISQTRKRLDTGKIVVRDVDGIRYLRKVHKYFNSSNKTYSFESDKWILDQLEIPLKQNPVKIVKTITFDSIPQEEIKETIKKVMLLHLKKKSVGTVCLEMTAVRRFTMWLDKEWPSIKSLDKIDRDVIEEYLIHTNTEACKRKSYKKELSHLKSVLNTAAVILENPVIGNLFFKYDTGKEPEKIFQSYSDKEIIRLNRAIAQRDEQIARILILHQLLGTRISETLTLTKDCLYKKGDQWFVHIYQIKTRKSYEKPVNDDVKKLIEKSILYTQEHFGMRNYIFVSKINPDMPMTYATIQYQLMAMIREQDLRDDHGNLFGVGTHIWRYTYGKKLTELNVDDLTIAKLLGHANISCVKYYRKMGDIKLEKDTREAREAMDKILRDITKEWD